VCCRKFDTQLIPTLQPLVDESGADAIVGTHVDAQGSVRCGQAATKSTKNLFFSADQSGNIVSRTWFATSGGTRLNIIPIDSTMAERAGRLTVADLVVLALLHERPMHGYAASAELEDREVRDWAGISRPQVYYSLKKLAEQGHVAPVDPAEDDASAGPERRVYAPTGKGTAALAAALERADWAEQRLPPPFFTWLALAHHAGPGAVTRQVGRRRAFLRHEAARERETLASFGDTDEASHVAARLMVDLTIRQFEAELAWLDEVERALGER
jgi:DNA-binding PadR family transcriptional regulator